MEIAFMEELEKVGEMAFGDTDLHDQPAGPAQFHSKGRTNGNFTGLKEP
jgi:hypothetical protein